MPQTIQTQNQPIEREPFRWLFRAYLKDGTTIDQPLDDKSIHHVEGVEHNPSAFTDVLDRVDEVGAFGLYTRDGKQGVVVDLITGNFVVNGTPICAHNQYFEPEKYKLDLVYFRETRVDKTIKADGEELHRHFVNRYFIGWKTTVNGEEKQVTLAVG